MDALCSAAGTKLNSAALHGSLKTMLARKGVPQNCDITKAPIRYEYGLMCPKQRLAYSNAVRCLMSKPSKIPDGLAPGAKSRYDDFVVVHINLTNIIHETGNFLAWHRYYTWAFERALQDECGYNGTVPYWNWAKSTGDILNSPYFDGSKYSQGGNGIWAPHNCSRFNLETPCLAPVVEGRGGGCVVSGPYADMVVNVASVQLLFNYPNEVSGPLLGYQPRCLRRDISPDSAALLTDDVVASVVGNHDHIGEFQDALQVGPGSSPTNPGIHALGHFIYIGDPAGDIWAAPGDPMFWLHHAGIDWAWWCWQNQDVEERMFQINGTRTMGNEPPSENATIDDHMWLDWVTPAGMPATDPQYNHVSSVGGPYCYVYA